MRLLEIGHVLLFVLLTKDRHVSQSQEQDLEPRMEMQAGCRGFTREGRVLWGSGPESDCLILWREPVSACLLVPEQVHQGRYCYSEPPWQGWVPAWPAGGRRSWPLRTLAYPCDLCP